MDYSNYANHQPQPYSLYGLPTPDQQPPQQSDDTLRDPFSLQPQQNAYNQYFPGLEGSLRLDPSSFVPPHSPPDSFTKHSVSSNDPNNHTKAESGILDGDENLYGDGGMARSSSEEKESMTPAQTKRKAQNRAAQRAFRERKERHVKDLEDKVNSLESASTSLQADNERLKRELAKFATENEILRATSGSLHTSAQPHARHEEPTVTGPMKYNPTDFYTSLMPEGSGWGPPPGSTPSAPPASHRVSVCQVTGEKLLDAGATWDFIQGSEFFKSGQVDIGDVAERLKGLAQCNGQGPAFKEGEIMRAIQASVAERDELI